MERLGHAAPTSRWEVVTGGSLSANKKLRRRRYKPGLPDTGRFRLWSNLFVVFVGYIGRPVKRLLTLGKEYILLLLFSQYLFYVILKLICNCYVEHYRNKHAIGKR